MNDIHKHLEWLVYSLVALATSLGLIAAYLFLKAFDWMAVDVMPSVFVDRKIPIQLSGAMFATSFFIPFCISYLFVRFSLHQFKGQKDRLLDGIRLN